MTAEAPLVSVIIPLHNNEPQFIRAAVESALGQTYQLIEVIVVDDGSTRDMTWVERAYQGRIRYLQKPNGGPASARNAGLDVARGKYIAFLDADDVWEPTKLREQVPVLQRAPTVGLVYTAVLDIDQQGRILTGVSRPAVRPSGRLADALFLKNAVSTSTALARRACFERVGRFDEARELISVEDYDMWLRIAEQYEVVCIDQPLTRYRTHAGGISRQIARPYDGQALVVAKAIQRRPGPGDAGRVSRRMARMWFDCGPEHFSAGGFWQARHI